MYTKLTDLPETIQSALNKLGYYKADISIDVSESVSPFVGSGDGLRGFCVILDIITGESDIKTGSWGGSNMWSPNNVVDCDTQSYKIPANVAVIKGTTGRDRVYATITLSPENVIKALPIKVELDPRLKWILAGYKSLTSQGRKNEYSRYNDTPSIEDLKKLVEMGFLKMNKAGICQITTEGKNCFKPLERVEHPKGFKY
jgi:hypothetical protein